MRTSTLSFSVLAGLTVLILGTGRLPERVAGAVVPGNNHGNRSLDPGEELPGSPAKQAAEIIPPLPARVSELKFCDFFVRPVGDRGLELTEKLLKLDGRSVRILGYMVRQESPPPGFILLTPVPAQIHEHDNGLADDLPASIVHVSVPTLRDQPVPYAPGLMLLTGTLSVGNRTEADGRISVVRLALDPPEPGANQQPMLNPRMCTDQKGSPDASSK